MRGMMSSTSWLTTLECSPSMIQSSDTSSSVVIQWLSFIFLSPCPQRILFSSIDILFLLILIVFAIQKLSSKFFSKSTSIENPLLQNETSQYKVTFWFTLSLVLTSLLALTYTVLTILSFTHGINSSWDLILVLFRLFHALTFIFISVLIAHEKKFCAAMHPISLRVYWIVNFVLVMLFAGSGITRLISNLENLDPTMRIDDVISLASVPFSVFLLVFSIRGITGIYSTESQALYEPVSPDPNVSVYARASWLSKLLWLWMNPLITKGYKSTLQIDDIPSLPHDHRAEKMAELFKSNWPKPSENSKNPVRTTLIRCFWKELLITGLLSVLRLAVMYVGPALIQSFVDYTSGDRSNPFEGYYLILILSVAKFVEVLSSHHFNFLTSKLGMLLRASIVSSLYSKGLRLSCSSRQDHGVGQIVNYMAVDAGQLADMMTQIHSVWMMPLQVVVAFLLLYIYMGVSSFSSFIIVIGIMVFVFIVGRQYGAFQMNVMINRDLRMKATNELLNNMRVIKFQAWEEHFSKRIHSFRELEYGWLGKFMYSLSFTMVVLWSSPVVLASVTFAVAILLGVPLEAGTVFTATTVFKILQEPTRAFPQVLMSISQSMVSLGRLDRFLTSKELEGGAVERGECSDGVAVEVIDGVFSWDDEGDDNKGLNDVNLKIKKGEFAAIVGTVGSGKSSLLASILGEMKKISGKVRVCGSTAYVAQTSWIQNGTIQQNILFGEPMNRQKYDEVIRVCSLERDLEIMEHGDETEIGERGINLSGGQKQRIQLARAVYQDSDIYLLDDVFSAVDAQTGSEIFKECARGALKDKTVLLVTHQVDFLHNADRILVMRDGKIVESGKYEELLQSGLDFGALVAAHETSMELVEMSTTTTYSNNQEPPIPTLVDQVNGDESASFGSVISLDRSLSVKANAKIIEDEEREIGQVNASVYKQYFTEAFGWWGVAGVVLVSVLWQGSLLAGDYWLEYQTSSEQTYNPSLFINVYSIIAAVSCVFVAVRAFFVTHLGLRTAQSFYLQILHSILHAPMSFFDTTPTGRILTRASTDQANVDLIIPLYLSMTILMYFSVFSILFVTIQYAWPIVFLLVPLIWLNMWYRGYFLATSRELTRLDSITVAPVIQHFSESITGVMTIRSFKKQDYYLEESIRRVNANLRMGFHNFGSNEWLGFRLEILGSFVLCASAMFMIVLPSSIIKPENVGMALSYGLPLNTVLFWTVYMSCVVENHMVSVERIKQFIRIPSEALWKKPENLPPPNWPTQGDVEIKNLQVRYRSNTPLVLRGISLKIRGGEKIGVVGRTGSGKSTLIQVFFRLVEPCGGTIIIDGIDICKLGLHDLRSRFGIIPQDPVLFQGTVRSNVDPIGLYSDEDIWKSLERCQLKDVVAAKPEKLDALVVDDGDNWSVGQRQLLCLGRVMLKRSKILFMDEATASVDSQTDAVIQKIIREDFSESTIITIAHRIPTVIDCDRVLVMDDGWAKEFESPTVLLEKPSMFSALVKEYSNRSAGL